MHALVLLLSLIGSVAQTPETYRFAIYHATAAPNASPLWETTWPASAAACDLPPEPMGDGAPMEIDPGGIAVAYDDPDLVGRSCRGPLVRPVLPACLGAPCPPYQGWLQASNAGGTAPWTLATPVLTMPLAPVVDCHVSEWTPWSAWSAWVPLGPTDTRTRTRFRVIVTPATNGGAACPVLTAAETETRTCRLVSGANLLAVSIKAAQSPIVAPGPGYVVFQLLNYGTAMIASVSAYLENGTRVAAPGLANVREWAGIWIRPPSPGTSKLFVRVTNSDGCAAESAHVALTVK